MFDARIRAIWAHRGRAAAFGHLRPRRAATVVATAAPPGRFPAGPKEVPGAVLADFLGHEPRPVKSRARRGQAAATPDRVPGWWLAVCAAAAIAVVAAALGQRGNGGLVPGPLLAIPAALAGIGAPTPRLPLAYGTLMLVTAVVLAPSAGGSLVWIAASVAVVTALSAVGVVLNRPDKQELASRTPAEQKLASVTSVAEVVQRALLPPLPRRVGPLELEV